MGCPVCFLNVVLQQHQKCVRQCRCGVYLKYPLSCFVYQQHIASHQIIIQLSKLVGATQTSLYPAALCLIVTS